MIIAFWVLALGVLLSALAVAALRNPLHSALGLTLNLLLVAGMFALLEAHFLALAQVIVYAGAIVVLMVFALMLLNLKSEQHKRREDYLAVAAIVLGSCFLLGLLPLLAGAFTLPAGGVEGKAGTALNIGRLIFSEYVFLFQAAGVLIIAALAGAVMLGQGLDASPSKGAAKLKEQGGGD